MPKETKYTPERVERIRKALSEGHTIRYACKLANLGEKTYQKWKAAKPEFAAMEKAAIAEYEEWLANSMVKDSKKSLQTLIMGQEYEETKTEYEQDPANPKNLRIKRKTTTNKKILPNVTAVIFALCNRDPENWKNRVEGSLNAKVESEGKQDLSLANVPDNLLEQVVEAINSK